MDSIEMRFFIENFMDISNNLTLSEIRMLYMLINNPYYSNISQEDFAKKLGTNRRTINIGLKKIARFNYIFKTIEINYNDENVNEYLKNHQVISDSSHEEKFAKNIVARVFKEYYYPFPSTLYVNEDFYSKIIGDQRLNLKYKYKKDFITATVKDFFPFAKFYIDLKKSDYTSETEYYLTREINIEIVKARKAKRYTIYKDIFFEYLSEKYGIPTEEVLKLLKSEFPNLKIVKNRIRVPQPWKNKL